MFRLALRELVVRRRRFAGTVLAVFLGVAFLAGTLSLSDTLRANFTNLFTDATAGTDTVVRSATDLTAAGRGPRDERQRGTVDPALVERIAGLPEVAAAVPVIEGYGQLIGRDGSAVGGNGPPRRAANWIADPELNPYRIAEGRAPERPGEVVVNRGAAREGDLSVGDTTFIETPARTEVHIVGIATFSGEDGFGRSTYVGLTMDDARRLLSGGSRGVSSILVRAAPGQSEEDVAHAVAAATGDGVEVLTGTAAAEEDLNSIVGGFVDGLSTFLLIFAGIALLVGAFSINNTFSILAAQRVRESALLRAVGATRRQLVASGLIETAVIGVVASALGLAGGIGLAGLLKGLFDAFGFALPAGGLVFSGGTIVASLAVGVVVTMLAGLLPILRSTRVAPLAALRDVAVDRTGTSRLRRATGALLTAAGAALLVTGGSAGLAGLGAVLTVAGTVALAPVLARPVAAILGAPIRRWRGIVGELARSNAMRQPRRTAGSATALLIGVGIVALLTVMAGSLRAGIDRSVDRTFAGDLVVTAPGFGGGALDPAVATAVAQLPEVAAAAGTGGGVATVDGSPQMLTVIDPGPAATVLSLDVGTGDLARLGTTSVAVSRDAATQHGWRVGSEVPLAFADGTQSTFTVAAVYAETGLVGDYVVSRAAYAPHNPQPVDRAVYVKVADGVGTDAGRRAVEAAVAPFGSPQVEDRDGYAATVAQGIDTMLGIVYVMLLLAVIIALMGIANTLSLAVHERTREIGLLRSVGQTRRQLRSMVRWESLIVSAFGTVVGVALGVTVGAGLVSALDADTAVLAIPSAPIAVIAVAGIAAGVVAAVRPARRAARLDVLAALATT